MELLRPAAAYIHKKADKNQINRVAANTLAHLTSRQHQADTDQIEYEIGRKSPHRGWASYLAAIGQTVAETSPVTLSGWAFDAEASKAASQRSGGEGYGNYQSIVWKERLTIVFSRVVAQEAEVQLLHPEPAAQPELTDLDLPQAA